MKLINVFKRQPKKPDAVDFLKAHADYLEKRYGKDIGALMRESGESWTDIALVLKRTGRVYGEIGEQSGK